MISNLDAKKEEKTKNKDKEKIKNFPFCFMEKKTEKKKIRISGILETSRG